MNWIQANLWRAAATLLLATNIAAITAWAWQTNLIEGFIFTEGYKSRVIRLEASVKEAREAHRQTKETYRIAQESIRNRHRAEVAEVEATQERITRNAASNYQRRIADLNDRLRRQTRAGASGLAGGADLSGAPAASGGAAHPPGDLTGPERELCIRQAIQLDELINWAIEQAGSDRFSGK